MSKFQRITKNTLYTNYRSQDAFDEEPDLRLATLVTNRNTQFSNDFSAYGHIYSFKLYKHDDDLEVKSTIPETSLPSSVGAIFSGIDNNREEEEQEQKSIPSRKLSDCGDIQDILHDYI